MQLPGITKVSRNTETPNPRRASVPAPVQTALAERATQRAGEALPASITEARPQGGADASARTAVAERPGVTRISESGLNLANPEKVNFSNALNLMKVCKEAYTDYNYAVGHTQFLYRNYGDHQVISYAGSKELKDWGHDANVVKKQYGNMGWVHGGFADAYDEIKALQDTLVDRKKPLVITGHSLGGATATVAALDLKQRGYNVHSVYTYGAPRVGYSDFKDIYGKAGIPTYRFINAWDVVPRIPKINYHHVGQPFYLSSEGKLLDRQETAWKLWPWNVPGERVNSHHLTGYMANLQKYIA